MDNSSSFAAIFSLLVVLVVVGLLIALIVVLIRKSVQQSKLSDETYYKVLQALPTDKQIIFTMQYNSFKKNPTTAVVLALFLGGLGIHKFYMGQVGLGILYLVFCWTYVPSFIALIEAFLISGQVRKHNHQKAIEISMMLGGTIPSGLLLT